VRAANIDDGPRAVFLGNPLNAIRKQDDYERRTPPFGERLRSLERQKQHRLVP
jgi:hypothetical protein